MLPYAVPEGGGQALGVFADARVGEAVLQQLGALGAQLLEVPVKAAGVFFEPDLELLHLLTVSSFGQGVVRPVSRVVGLVGALGEQLQVDEACRQLLLLPLGVVWELAWACFLLLVDVCLYLLIFAKDFEPDGLALGVVLPVLDGEGEGLGFLVGGALFRLEAVDALVVEDVEGDARLAH